LGSAVEDSNWPPTALASPPSPAPGAHYAEQTGPLTLFLAGHYPITWSYVNVRPAFG